MHAQSLPLITSEAHASICLTSTSYSLDWSAVSRKAETNDVKMINENKALMAKYGITAEPKMIYFYKLKDALRYAEIDTNRVQGNSQRTLTEK